MKNIYITSIPMLGRKKLNKMNYIPQDEILCDKDYKTAFPIISVIKKTMDSNVDNKVIAIRMKNSDSEYNLKLFEEELRNINVDPNCIVCVELEEDSRYATGVDMFLQLAKEIENDSYVYACITYGTKIMSMVITYVLSSIEYLKRNVVVRSVCYGQVDRMNDEVIRARIWEVIGLLRINELVKTLFEARFDNPMKALEELLNVEK